MHMHKFSNTFMSVAVENHIISRVCEFLVIAYISHRTEMSCT